MSRRKKRHIVIGVKEVHIDGVLVGYQIFDPPTDRPLYQVCPLDECLGWGVALIAHEDPFEMVDLGYYPSATQAIQAVERDIIKQHISKGESK